MKKLEEIKSEILKRTKKIEACEDIIKASASETVEDLLKAVKKNLRWVCNKLNLNTKFLEHYFGVELLKAYHIYTSGSNSVEIKEGEIFIWVLDSSSVNVKTLYNSTANVTTLDNSSKLTFEVKGDSSFIRHHNERKIYVKKNNFEIVEVD